MIHSLMSVTQAWARSLISSVKRPLVISSSRRLWQRYKKRHTFTCEFHICGRLRPSRDAHSVLKGLNAPIQAIMTMSLVSLRHSHIWNINASQIVLIDARSRSVDQAIQPGTGSKKQGSQVSGKGFIRDQRLKTMKDFSAEHPSSKLLLTMVYPWSLKGVTHF